ncbi:MAG: methyltransferase domain-containing protein [Pseudomonadota bacterium]|nr:methyltransferase domain-containing protein [Pseudomonadota bacterium]
MSSASPNADQELWSEWLAHGRHGDDPAYAAALHATVRGYVDRVLDAAALAPGQTLLDLGSGEGALAWRAIERVGPDLAVIVSELFPALLATARARARALGVEAQCRFVQADAVDLGAVATESVDAVTARSVLAYVADKRAALRECLRVLKPGGVLSLAEPVFQDEAFEANLLRHRLETQPGADQDMGLRLLHRWKSAQFPDTLAAIAAMPMCSHSERDLLRFAMAEGFVDLHLQLDIRVAPSPVRDWALFLEITPHPWAPNLRSILRERCTAEEAALFEHLVRPAVEAGVQPTTDRMVYLSARKPARS